MKYFDGSTVQTVGSGGGGGGTITSITASGALTGGGTWHSDDRTKKRVWNGMLTILIDPKRLGTGDAFAAETTAFLESLRKSPVAPGNDKVRIAGEPERETRRDLIVGRDDRPGEAALAAPRARQDRIRHENSRIDQPRRRDAAPCAGKRVANRAGARLGLMNVG